MRLVTRLNDWTEPKDINTWWIQILYWRTHLDVFIVDILGVKLKDTQRVIARAIGNGVYSDIVQSRGKPHQDTVSHTLLPSPSLLSACCTHTLK